MKRILLAACAVLVAVAGAEPAVLHVDAERGAAAAASADPRKVQDLPQFRAAFPSFPCIPVEKIGLER